LTLLSQFGRYLLIRTIAPREIFQKNPTRVARNEYSLDVIRFRGGKGEPHAARCNESGPLRTGVSYQASFYMDAYRAYQAAMASLGSGPPLKDMDLVAARAKLFEHRVRARWALAARGLESLPFALQMLRSADIDERDDARGILARMGSDDEVMDALLLELRQATEPGIFGEIIVAIGATGNTRAIPVLVAILRDPAVDQASKSATIRSLGKLAQRRFDQSEDPLAALNAWLDTNGYVSIPVGLPKIPQISTLRQSADRSTLYPFDEPVEPLDEPVELTS
jgi:hypothetical protein